MTTGRPDTLPLRPDWRARWGRPLALATAIVFVISSAFPIAAIFTQDTAVYPKWWGALDVVIAFVLAILAFAVTGLARGKVDQRAEAAAYRAYRILLHGIFVLILAFFLFGDRITWINGLPGIAWRSWLLLYCLPAWFALIKT